METGHGCVGITQFFFDIRPHLRELDNVQRDRIANPSSQYAGVSSPCTKNGRAPAVAKEFDHTGGVYVLRVLLSMSRCAVGNS